MRIGGGDDGRVRPGLGGISGQRAADDTRMRIDTQAGGQAGGGEDQSLAVGIAKDGANSDGRDCGPVGGGDSGEHVQRIAGRDRVRGRAGIGRVDDDRRVVGAGDADDQRRLRRAAIAVRDRVGDRLGRRGALCQAVIGRAGIESIGPISRQCQHAAAGRGERRPDGDRARPLHGPRQRQRIAVGRAVVVVAEHIAGCGGAVLGDRHRIVDGDRLKVCGRKPERI